MKSESSTVQGLTGGGYEPATGESGRRRNPITVVNLFVRVLRENRFLILLVFLLLLIIVSPQLPNDRAGRIVHATLVSLVLLGALDCLSFKKGGMLTTRWFGLITLLSGWLQPFIAHPLVVAAANAFRIGFFLMVTGALIYQVARSARVSLALIVGAIDGYIMIGIVGAGAFAIVEALIPGSIRFPSGVASTTDFLYFSFITMLTIGYGDVLPVSPASQTVAVFLGIGGQLYIAILVSMLVGKFLSASQSSLPSSIKGNS